MEKVHIIKWLPTGRVDSVYSDYEKACRIVKKSNDNLKWYHKMTINAKWIVTTYDVKD